MKLTADMLKKIVKQEINRVNEGFGKMKDADSEKAKETDADEYADALEKKHDFYKALGLEEARLVKRLRKIQEQRKRLAESLRHNG